jgi:hypothetical protein
MQKIAIENEIIFYVLLSAVTDDSLSSFFRLKSRMRLLEKLNRQ